MNNTLFLRPLLYIRIIVLIPIFMFLSYPQCFGQSTYVSQDDHEFASEWSIRAGVFGGAGMSKLKLADHTLPEYAGSDYFTFSYDPFAMAGAVIKIQTPLFARRLSIVIDPAFAKYSYGSYSYQQNDDQRTAMDIDLEAIRLPITLHYRFLGPGYRLTPYLGLGYVNSFYSDKEFYLQSRHFSDGNWEPEPDYLFEYANYQNGFLFALGTEYHTKLGDLYIELVAEAGDGIYKDKYGEDFMRTSRTMSFYTRMGVLF